MIPGERRQKASCKDHGAQKAAEGRQGREEGTQEMERDICGQGSGASMGV